MKNDFLSTTRFLILCTVTLIVGCSTTDQRQIHIADSEYKSVLEKHSRQSKTYSGFTNTLDIRATLITSQVREAQALRKATSFQWSDVELQAERDYQNKAYASETRVFLSFFTPESKDDNLSKSDTVWRIFLDVNGKRYPGVAQKMMDTQAEIHDLYPEHTRWGTPYLVKFLIPSSQVEGVSSRLTITGPVGSTSLDF